MPQASLMKQNESVKPLFLKSNPVESDQVRTLLEESKKKLADSNLQRDALEKQVEELKRKNNILEDKYSKL